MVNPPRILLYFAIISLALFALVFVIPDTGIPIGKSMRLHWISLNDIFPEVDATDSFLIKDSLLMAESVTLQDSLPTRLSLQDSIVTNKVKNKNPYVKLEYNQEFEPLLKYFYIQLQRAKDTNQVVRVLHMGDSQIEGDRITRYLRDQFQIHFGGSGPGFIPIYDPQKQFSSVWITNSGHWQEHVVFHYPRTIAHKEYGILGRVATINAPDQAAVSIYPSKSALELAKRYYSSKLLIKNITQPLHINAYWNSTQISADTLSLNNDITQVEWSFKDKPTKFKLVFHTQESPLFLGIALDSLGGVAVDNISMRGQSSPRLDKTNKQLFSAMASHLDIGLIVWQFGTNMVPTIASNYHFYYKMLSSQLKIIKETIPNVPVVIVGVGDVAHISNGTVNPYDHISKINEAQKKAALDAGFAFFDLYNAMGGEGSIIKWVNHDPRLAMSDYTHFNANGGKKVADWIYEAIMNDFENVTQGTSKVTEFNQ